VIVLISVLGYFLAFSVTLPVAVLYVVVSLAFVIFYIVTVVKIIKKMSTSENMRQKKGKVLSEVRNNHFWRLFSFRIYESREFLAISLFLLINQN
jgi:membrane-bound ClpP family serine protease